MSKDIPEVFRLPVESMMTTSGQGHGLLGPEERDPMGVVRMTLCLPQALWEAVQAGASVEGDAHALILRAVEEYLVASDRRLQRDQPGRYQQLIERLRLPIAHLRLSARAALCLARLNVRYLYDLVQESPGKLRAQRNFGEKSFREVHDKLAALGLRLGMTLDRPTYAEAVTAAVVAGMAAAAEAHGEPNPPEPSRSEDAPPPLDLASGTSATTASPGADAGQP